MALANQVVARSCVQAAHTRHSGIHRRVSERLGSGMRGRQLARGVEEVLPHQLAGTTRGPDRPTAIESPTEIPDSSVHDRQHDSGRVYSKPRRHEVTSSSQADHENLDPSDQARSDPGADTHKGPEQRVSRPGISCGTDSASGMDTNPIGVVVASESIAVGSTTSGAIREPVESSAPSIHVSMRRRKRRGNRRAKMPVAQPGSIRVHSDIPTNTAATTHGEGAPVPHVASSELDSTGQVDPLAGDPTSVRSQPIPRGRAATQTAPLGSRTGSVDNCELDSVDPGEEGLDQLGFSEEVVTMIEGSRARSTKTQYKLKWTLFMAWCRDNGLNPRQAGLPLLTRFLLYLFRELGRLKIR